MRATGSAAAARARRERRHVAVVAGTTDGANMDDKRNEGGDAVERRFADALVKARAGWAAADAAACAARAGCSPEPGGVVVPFFGAPHLVTHPEGEVGAVTSAGATGAAAGPAPAHIAVTVLLLHYLLGASGAPPVGSWATYRELPGGLFYAASFAARAEEPLVRTFGADAAGLAAFVRAAGAAGGEPLDLADAAFSFTALPRVTVAVLVWRGDDEDPGDARVLFDAGAEDYLPPEDLAGLGGLLCRRLIGA